MRGIIAPAATCRTGGSTGPRSRGSSAPAGGRGTRTVASYDEDTTTWGSRRPGSRCAARPRARPRHRCCSPRSRPAYLDKTNATTIHAALRLDADVTALDVGGAVRSGVGALETALGGGGTTLVVSADMRTGLPGSADEASRRRRRGRADRRRRRRRSRDRRVPRRRVGHRGVHRPVAHAGRLRVQAVGGALRRDPVRPARRAGVDARARSGRRRGRADRPSRHRHRAARPGRQGAQPQASASAKDAIVDDLPTTVGSTGAAHAASAAGRRARDRPSPAR